MTGRWALTVALVLAGAGGCNLPATPSATPPAAVDDVDAVSVLGPPNAADWDGRDGPDGLNVSVHLWRADRDLPVTVRGRIEFVLYEGVLHAADLPNAKPFQQWSFPGAALPRHLGRSVAGWGYLFRLPFSRMPGTSAVTLTTCYVSPTGLTVRPRQPAVFIVRPT